MSRYQAESLWQLLPAIYRQRDAERAAASGAEHGPLRSLVEVLARQAEVVDGDIRQLYENLFIETSDDWVVPYIGDLLGVRGAHPIGFTRRAEVADTLRFRRRKGTAAVLEDLARAATGWPSRVVEFFELLATTQHLNHLRPHAARPDLRDAAALELLDGPFDATPHSAGIRPIARREGRYNIPNVGLFLWRLRPFGFDGLTPFDLGDGRRFTFHPLGLDVPFFHNPESETSPLHIAEEVNVPGQIRRRAFHDARDDFYGTGLDIELFTGDGDTRQLLEREVRVCNLAEWQHTPEAGQVAIDPVLGRIAFAEGAPDAGGAPAPLEDGSPGFRVRCFHAFSAAIGGGPYDRPPPVGEGPEPTVLRVPDEHASVSDALAAWDGSGDAVVEIEDSRTREEAIDVEIPAGRRLTIRAAEGERPTLLLSAEARFSGGEASALDLDGLLIAGQALRIEGELDRLRILDCTLAPVVTPAAGPAPLILASGNTEARLERCLLGPIATHSEATVEIVICLVDGQEGGVAYAHVDDPGDPGGPLTVRASTLLGEVRCREMSLGENSLFLDRLEAERRQRGCVRFSYLPADSIAPRRYRCQPAIPDDATPELAEELMARLVPRFTSLRFGDPGYGQLRRSTPEEIRRGAEDGSEMGVFSFLQQPQREDNLRLRLDEYLRFGLEAGIFFAT